MVFLDSSTLENDLYAVHASYEFPLDGTLIAGMKHSASDVEMGMYHPDIRATLHFALGELARPVGEDWMTWEKCPYAVITPLKDLLPRMINLNCYDTFILGNFPLTSHSTLVLPQDKAHLLKSEHRFSIKTFDPECQKIRDIVDQVIQDRGGLSIRMEQTDSEDRLGVAILQKENINTPEFFASLKQKYPQIGVGLRFNPLDGKGYLFSALEAELIHSSFYLLNYQSPASEGDEDKVYRNRFVSPEGLHQENPVPPRSKRRHSSICTVHQSKLLEN